MSIRRPSAATTSWQKPNAWWKGMSLTPTAPPKQCVPVGVKLKDLDSQDDVAVADRGKCSICKVAKRTFLGNSDPRLVDLPYDPTGFPDDVDEFSWAVHVLQCGHSDHARCLAGEFRTNPYGEFIGTDLEVPGTPREAGLENQLYKPPGWSCPQCRTPLSRDDIQGLRPYTRPTTLAELDALPMVLVDERSAFWHNMAPAARRNHEEAVAYQQNINAQRQRCKDLMRAEWDEVERLRQGDAEEQGRNYRAAITAREAAIARRDLGAQSAQATAELQQLQADRDQFRTAAEAARADLDRIASELAQERELREQEARVAALVRDQDMKQATDIAEDQQRQIDEQVSQLAEKVRELELATRRSAAAEAERDQLVVDQERIRRESYDQAIEDQRIKAEEAERKKQTFEYIQQDDFSGLKGLVNSTTYANVLHDGKTILDYAIIMGKPNIIANMGVESGWLVGWDAGRINGMPYLDYIYEFDRIDVYSVYMVASLQISMDWDPTLRGAVWPAPLWSAVSYGAMNIAKFLIEERNVNVLITPPDSEQNIVQLATAQGHEALAEYLTPIVGAKKLEASEAAAASKAAKKKAKRDRYKANRPERSAAGGSDDPAPSPSPPVTPTSPPATQIGGGDDDDDSDFGDADEAREEREQDAVDTFSNSFNTDALRDFCREHLADYLAHNATRENPVTPAVDREMRLWRVRLLPAVVVAAGGINGLVTNVRQGGGMRLTISRLPIIMYAISCLSEIWGIRYDADGDPAANWTGLAIAMVLMRIEWILSQGGDLNTKVALGNEEHPVLFTLINTRIPYSDQVTIIDSWIKRGGRIDFLAVDNDGEPDITTFAKLVDDAWRPDRRDEDYETITKRVAMWRKLSFKKYEEWLTDYAPGFKEVFVTNLNIVSDPPDISILPTARSAYARKRLGEELFVAFTYNSWRDTDINRVAGYLLLKDKFGLNVFEGGQNMMADDTSMRTHMSFLEIACFQGDMRTVLNIIDDLDAKYGVAKAVGRWEMDTRHFRSTVIAALEGYITLDRDTASGRTRIGYMERHQFNLVYLITKLVERGAHIDRPGRLFDERDPHYPQQLVMRYVHDAQMQSRLLAAMTVS